MKYEIRFTTQFKKDMNLQKSREEILISFLPLSKSLQPESDLKKSSVITI